jgi:hypothetical protein
MPPMPSPFTAREKNPYPRRRIHVCCIPDDKIVLRHSLAPALLFAAAFCVKGQLVDSSQVSSTAMHRTSSAWACRKCSRMK